jgi:hypothetical protein
VIRERIARALLRAYPAPTRARLGAEMIGTVLDSSDTSGRMFTRECVALVAAGARARAHARASEKLSGQLVEGYVLAGQIWMGVLLSHGTAQFLHQPSQGVAGGLLFVMALWPILAMSLIGARRTAGAAGTIWFVCLILIVGGTRPGMAVIWLIPLSSCLVMATCQQNRRRDRRRLVWLAPVATLSLLLPSGEPMVGALQIDGLIFASALAIAIFPIDLRGFVACATLWSGVGLMSEVPYRHSQPVALVALIAPLILLALLVTANSIPSTPRPGRSGHP